MYGLVTKGRSVKCSKYNVKVHIDAIGGRIESSESGESGDDSHGVEAMCFFRFHENRYFR